MHSNDTKSTWTEDKVKTLVEMHEAGATAQKIADALGLPTRNTVCGKIARMGLKRDKKAETAPKETPVQKPQKYPQIKKGTAGANAAGVLFKIKAKANGDEAPVLPIRVVHDAADIKPRMVSLLDLGPDDCKWPYGDGPFQFCGCPRKHASPYCFGHHALAFSPRPTAVFGSEEHRQKISEALRARAASRRAWA